MTEYELYVDLIKNPFAPKKYRELAKYYKEIDRLDESDAFWHAINIKFETTNDDNPSVNQEQCTNISEMP